MGRKLAEATKACRMRRTRGEIVRLCVLAERRLAALAGDFAPAAVLLAVVFEEGPLLPAVVAASGGVFFDGVSAWL
jgi:hypothetical protein